MYEDPTDPEAYRPISLINQDADIFMAILAKRMNIFLTNHIEEDQNGFGISAGK